MPNPVAYFELGGKDPEKLSDFYSELFDWSSEAMGAAMPGLQYFHVQTNDGIPGGIMQTNEEMGMPPNYVMFYVSVDDIQASLDKAESLGGQTLVPPTEIPGGRGSIAVFQDPQDNVIGLHKF